MENLTTQNQPIEELENLFTTVPPQQLRQSIHQIFARYLQTINNETDLEEFKMIAEDFYFLNRFLEKVESLEL
jgi:hypothetical protein